MIEPRSTGNPSLAAGAIYPMKKERFTVEPFEIPGFWPKAYGMDVGWNFTAAVWGAHDRGTDTLYIYTEHYEGHALPSVHAESINARGKWIPGVIDPSANLPNLRDGEALLAEYLALDLNLTKAINAVDAGILAVWKRMYTGRLKVFSSCSNLLAEHALYRRDKEGKIVKKMDHAMDACLVGETLVVTDQGAVPIRDLVSKEGQVLTRSGAWAKFIGARLTIKAAPTITLAFADGTEVRCTPDHPFLTPEGWVPAEAMPGRSCYNGISQRKQWAPWTRSLSRRPFKSLRAFATICAASISSALVSAFIGLFGPGSIGGSRRVAFMSTIGTMIDPTMPQAISSFSPEQSTSVCTQRASLSLCPQPLALLLRSGTPPRPAGVGIADTSRPTEPSCWPSGISSANNAVPSSRPRTRAGTVSAPTPARRHGASRLALTISNGLAWFAAALSWRIATARNRHALERAVVRCLGGSDAGLADVYCLTVPGTSAFCVEGGLVVHNTRYLVISGLSIATTAPIKTTEDAGGASSHASGY